MKYLISRQFILENSRINSLKSLILFICIFGYISNFFNHKGFFSFIRFVIKVFPIKIPLALIKIKIDNKYFLTFNFNDYYWLRLVSKFFIYEEEIGIYLSTLNKLGPFHFYDLGANIGFWSLHAGNLKNCTKVVSIEPFEYYFNLLQVNLQQLKIAHESHCFAVSDSNNHKTKLYHSSNYYDLVGSSLSNVSNFNSSTLVKNVNHRALINTLSLKTNLNYVIKLDIEGQELNFIKELPRDKINYFLIYEDHKKFDNNLLSEYLFQNNWFLYYINENRIIRLNDVKDVLKIKTSSRKGYNFMATRVILNI